MRMALTLEGWRVLFAGKIDIRPPNKDNITNAGMAYISIWRGKMSKLLVPLLSPCGLGFYSVVILPTKAASWIPILNSKNKACLQNRFRS